MQRNAAIPTFLITGSNGQVGFELRRSLAPLGKVVALDRSSCDLSQPDDIRRAVREHQPDVIVNPAAYTAVDRAESEPELAYAINGTAVGVLAEEAKALGSLLVHYSTDYVFDGTKAGAYVETDSVNPQSVYGKSKLAGEQAITAAGAAHLVFRTCWVAGAHGSNFAKTMLKLGRERDSLRVIADQFGAPTTAALIADVTAQVVARHWLSSDRTSFASGIYHLAAAGETTWHAYASEVLCYAAAKGIELKVDPARIEAIPATAYPLPAPRPANSRLDTSKLRQTFGIHLPDWQQGLHYLLDQIFS
ncbi:dTDP-4-dehydrorhamnose reductase [Cupriavidus taiwanensis]|uniref:dTDP-4-dehydrorhamnose reductase n=1 Tax=Cupriavidus taiwanensis TaxID=164546 RepID=A0A7Z7JCS9_9BURK|nr:dTDP-4-dehydrorhamnose reductase [Cupriavidus taiwanensis]SOY88865.1 TDP-rhamnose synthetase, NAD(P)-binding [Cupriavidus taiwanensis]SOZ02968.1 TDP-rhamnose synthetase, NAD(P)-binding [Cupriavidus taiwanensis]SOZ06243.1 TDP-rhamnose synthetase, NAD(P)-binding [Cupriavidus taiwanensis]SPC18774.1 TDP-rhamnose synthetase, NAD(P)-binding [Cupriavidus taiwanensis]SPD41144.1 dTDP-4-dehydrorhamnose reductase subunit, NAD(P)-binding, of dTDP-L-rhamnose synthase [Cupriavidus taiwanensis]